eukprot:scaffold611332_cov20-Prasinocladus_malaysianus.AAC.1
MKAILGRVIQPAIEQNVKSPDGSPAYRYGTNIRHGDKFLISTDTNTNTKINVHYVITTSTVSSLLLVPYLT